MLCSKNPGWMKQGPSLIFWKQICSLLHYFTQAAVTETQTGGLNSKNYFLTVLQADNREEVLSFRLADGCLPHSCTHMALYLHFLCLFLSGADSSPMDNGCIHAYQSPSDSLWPQGL